MKKIEIISQRKWGEPRLKKPDSIKDIKQSETVTFMKASCPVFIHDGNIWVKHRDFFSPFISKEKAKEIGIQINQKQKFIYKDDFGVCVLRGEAWIKVPFEVFENAMDENKYVSPWWQLVLEFEKVMGIEEGLLFSHPWIYFFEQLTKIYIKQRSNQE